MLTVDVRPHFDEVVFSKYGSKVGPIAAICSIGSEPVAVLLSVGWC